MNGNVPHKYKPSKRKRELPSLTFDTSYEEFRPSLMNGPISNFELNVSGTSITPVDDDDDRDIVQTSMHSVPAKCPRKRKNIAAGDIAWVRHSAKNCFWPAHVKAVRNMKISILYICYNKFCKGEKSFTFPLKSKKIKLFSIDNDELIEAGKKYYECSTSKHDPTALKDFKDAVDLAEVYVREREKGNREFQKEDYIFTFFRTRGINFYHQLCIEEHKHRRKNDEQQKQISNNSNETLSSNQNEAASPIRHSTRIKAKEKVHGRKSYLFKEKTASRKSFVGTKQPPADSTAPPHGSDLQTHYSPVEFFSPNSRVDEMNNSQTETTPLENSADKRKQRQLKQAKGGIAKFNKRNEVIVKYINAGKCDRYLTDVYYGNVPSIRMDRFRETWCNGEPTLSSLSSLQMTYFESSDQQTAVAIYLVKFTQGISEISQPCSNNATARIKLRSLIMDVLYPESVIAAIRSCFRRTPEGAMKVYNDGYRGPKMPSSAIDNHPLTEEDHQMIRYKNKRQAKKLGIYLE